MSRISTNDQTLIDRLSLNDTDAFEELYRHYWHGLYLYCLKKLQSPEDAKKIVRTIFIGIWEQRHTFPVSFVLSRHLYTEVRKMVVKAITEKLADINEQPLIEKRLSTELSVQSLQAARRPVSRRSTVVNKRSELIRQHTGQIEAAHYSPLDTFRWMFQSFTNKLSLINILSYPKN
jgi:RNA polymerase sigma-70 factor (ECF subfamily)